MQSEVPVSTKMGRNHKKEMADLNLTNIGYRSQEVLVSNARISRVFWRSSRIRDNQQFQGTAKKTLLGQGLESVFAPGAGQDTSIGEQDLPQWRGASTQDVDPG